MQFYTDQSQAMATFLRILGLTLTAVFSLGAILGAMITMYAAVAGRVTEIGTLRALGFRRRTELLLLTDDFRVATEIGEVHTHFDGWRFTEWFHGRTGKPMGMAGQSWNAAAWLLAQRALERGASG